MVQDLARTTEKESMSYAPNPPRRTIQGDLSIGISMVILITTAVLCGIFIAMKAQLDRRTLEQKANILTANMVTALGGPLWSANDSELNAIAKTFSTDEGIVQFTINDFRGDRIYGVGRPSESDLVREREFLQDGNVIGKLKVRYSTRSLDQGKFEWVASAIALSLILNVMLVLFVRKIIARVMNPTVDLLGQGLGRITSGDYAHKLPVSKYARIDAIYAEINRLAATIRKRESDLSQHAEFLESEKKIALSLLADSVGKIITGFLSSATTLPYVKAMEFVSAKTDLPFIGPVPDQFYSPESQAWRPLQFNADGRLFPNYVDLATANGVIGHFVFYTSELPDKVKEAQLKRLTFMCAETIHRHLANQRASALEANLDRSRVMVNEISRAVHILAHDVRKPFTMISMMFNELERSGSPEAQHEVVAKYTRPVQGSILLANGLIGDVMTLGAASTLKRAATPLKAVVGEALELVFALESKRSNIRFAYALNHRHQLLVDKPKLVRVLFNVIENAAQAMRFEGTMTFTSRETDRHVVLTIANDGPEIPPFVLNRLFEPYYTHGKSNGTGLGLAIAKEIATAHGGDIAVTSTANETAFALTLPFDGQAPEGAETLRLPENSALVQPERLDPRRVRADAADEFRLRDKAAVDEIVAVAQARKAAVRVLLIDDEALYLRSLRSELSHFGIPKSLLEIDEAATPQEALKFVASKAYDLIVCDLQLKDDRYDGFGLVARFRQDGVESHVVINSNSFGEDVARRALAAGADQFLAKPPTREQLLQAVASSLRSKTVATPRRRLTIYLAEDNVLFLQSWERELEGHDLVTFTSSDACVEALENSPRRPDVLLTDLYFDDSKANGVEVAQVAKAKFDIPVILSTEGAEAPDAGVFDLVTDKNLIGVKEFIRRRKRV